MSLDESKPNDSSLFSEMDNYQRETREAVNDLASTIIGQITAVDAVTSISGQAISAKSAPQELRLIDTDGTLSYITGADEGHIAYIKVRAGHSLTVNHSATKVQGTFYLNGIGNNLAMSEYDVIALVNIDGDAATGTDGYWEELFRTIWA